MRQLQLLMKVKDYRSTEGLQIDCLLLSSFENHAKQHIQDFMSFQELFF